MYFIEQSYKYQYSLFYFSKESVVTAIHVAQTTYSDYEHGKVRIPIESIIDLAKLYDVNMNYITGVSNVKTEYPKK